MNIIRFQTWSERQQVLAIILMAGLIIGLLWFFILIPQTRQRRQLNNQIQAMRSELARRSFLRDVPTLQKFNDDETRHTKELLAQWSELASRLATFTNQNQLVSAEVGNIDFKVALLDIRQRLLRKARSANISMPRDLGMPELVTSNEDARKLLLQVRSVEKIVDLSLDLNISRVRNIEPLPPMRHGAEIAGGDFMEEYPVSIEFQGSLDSVYELLQAILRSSTPFILKALRIESMEQRGGTLKVNAVVSSLLFIKDPGKIELRAMATKPTRSGPLGH
jgi:Tfp pilus assembly protein PilO